MALAEKIPHLDITRPELFPECNNCHIANSFIDKLAHLKPTEKPQIENFRPTRIKISCQLIGNQVFLTPGAVYEFQYNRDSGIREHVYTSKISPSVHCPHLIRSIT